MGAPTCWGSEACGSTKKGGGAGLCLHPIPRGNRNRVIPHPGTAGDVPQAPRAQQGAEAPSPALTQLRGVGAGGVRGKARPLNVVGDLPADPVDPLEVPVAQHGRVQVVRGHQVFPQHVVVLLEAHHVTFRAGFSA